MRVRIHITTNSKFDSYIFFVISGFGFINEWHGYMKKINDEWLITQIYQACVDIVTDRSRPRTRCYEGLQKSE